MEDSGGMDNVLGMNIEVLSKQGRLQTGQVVQWLLFLSGCSLTKEVNMTSMMIPSKTLLFNSRTPTDKRTIIYDLNLDENS